MTVTGIHNVKLKKKHENRLVQPFVKFTPHKNLHTHGMNVQYVTICDRKQSSL